MESQKPESRAVLVGYDCRFMAQHFARRVAEVLAGNSFQAQLLDRPFPTPYVSYEAKRQGLAGAVMVTASHNPPEFCGIKFKAPFGGSATPAIVKEIERQLFQTTPRLATGAQQVEVVAPRNEYFD